MFGEFCDIGDDVWANVLREPATQRAFVKYPFERNTGRATERVHWWRLGMGSSRRSRAQALSGARN
eukprot:3952945-Prymnesium_polylepis.1